MASSRLTTFRVLLSFALSIPFSAFAGPSILNLVENDNGDNRAVLAGVSHGDPEQALSTLPGIQADLDAVTEITANKNYSFHQTVLSESKATVKAITDRLTADAEAAGTSGTLFFYFSGHGEDGTIWPEDRWMKIAEIRDAIEKGRAKVGPLERLVMIFDTCHSGSLVSPLSLGFPLEGTIVKPAKADRSQRITDGIFRAMRSPSRSSRMGSYWKKMFIFASSRSEEYSLATEEGSVFTKAMSKSFEETAKAGGTIGDFIEGAKGYTYVHHPVARLEPASLRNEKLVP